MAADRTGAGSAGGTSDAASGGGSFDHDEPTDRSAADADAVEADPSVHADAGHHLLTPGGKIDKDAVRRAYEASLEAGEDDPDARRVTITLQRDLRSRLDKWLTSRVTYLSRSKLQRLIDDGGVHVNGLAAKASTKLRLHDQVSIVAPPPSTGHILPEPMPLVILYEDDDLVVINKSADVIVHPARSENTGTLIHGLAWHFRHVSGGELSQVGEEYARPGVVHRLDRHTSGCIVFAKDDTAHWRLGEAFQRREVDKRYLAVVQGEVKDPVQAIDLPLGPHPSKLKGYREKQVVRHDELGKPSLTICRVRERYRLHDRPVGDQWFTLVELELKTGRTHQIRVHLSHLGWPIVGDDMYGGRAFCPTPDGDPLIERQALHAATLAFAHPRDGREMAFAAPVRDDFAALIGFLRREGEPASLQPAGATLDLDALLPGPGRPASGPASDPASGPMP